MQATNQRKPRNVRNFWVDLEVEGRASKVSTGPRNKGEGFTLRIKQRDKGGIVDALRIEGIAEEDGKLTLCVFPSDAFAVASILPEGLKLETQR